MKPYIIRHMLSSINGMIDGAALRAVTRTGEYEATGANPKTKTAVPLKLKSVEQREKDALWIRYEVVRS